MAASVLLAVGTRPEAIKTAPVVLALRRRGVGVTVVASGQHEASFAEAFACFGLEPDLTLQGAGSESSLSDSMSRVLSGVADAIARVQPDMVLVQGDTTTTLASALAAFQAQVPLAHIEAGLRTGDLAAPFPEEMYRLLVGRIADLHFAPTRSAAEALAREGVDPGRVHVTGNPVIDALDLVSASDREPSSGPVADLITSGRRIVLVTAHRRESQGAGIACVCDAVAEIARRFEDVSVVFVRHPNPKVAGVVSDHLRECGSVTMLDALDYVTFLGLMARSTLVISDSGGVQEEAPALGVPVIVTRDCTEREEAVQSGSSVLAGRDAARIVSEAVRILSGDVQGPGSERVRLFGDGHAADRIAKIIEAWPGAVPSRT